MPPLLRRPRRLLTPLLLTYLLAVGCASTRSAPDDPAVAYDPNAPRTLLVGAQVDQARAVAMGAAADKGWRIAESSADRLVIQRPLNAAAAEAVSPGSSLGPTQPKVEVTTGFRPRPDGTEVSLMAEVLSADPQGAEVRQSFTDTYRAELEQSLRSLRRAWETASWRVVGALPPVPEPAPPADIRVAAAEPQTEAQPQAQPSAPVPVPASREAAALPVTRPVVAPQPPAAAPVASAPNDMLRLNVPVPTGIWAYYAEHYARIRGCNLAGEGAVLINKTPEFEEHRVYCEDGKTFLVRCNAGTCRGLM
jgi:hypothetical protein